MDEKRSTRLIEVFPDLADELRVRLRSEDEKELAETVSDLRIVERCRCGDEFCGTFYTIPKPRGSYGPTHRTIDLDVEEGMLIVDVVDERIVCVEVLYRDRVRDRLAQLFK